MAQPAALPLADLPVGARKTIPLGDRKVLLVRTADVSGEPAIFAVEAECPHAKAPLEKGAVCNGRLVCPFHVGTFALATGAVVEPPPLRDLKRWPVAVVGSQIVVQPEPIAPAMPEPIEAGRHIVLAGAGAATAAALSYLQASHFAGSVTVIDPQAEEPIDRTTLTKQALSGDKPLDKLALFPSQAALSLQIDRVQDRIRGIDQAAKTVAISGGNVAYDALLLATGGKPKAAGLPGEDLPHVFTIRHADDLRRMEPLLGERKRAVLIGDSFIAFEAASALQQRGLACTVLARSEQPFAKRFGADVAKALVDLHRSKGVVVRCGTEAATIGADAVNLKSGETVPADLVIVAVGVEPAVDYAGDLPRGKLGGIEVGKNLRAVEGVWVAGDIASVDGVRIEHWRLAEQHGRVAAAAMLASFSGEDAPAFHGVPLFWTAHFGKRFNYLGHAETWDDLHLDGSPGELKFLVFYMQAGHVAAVTGCGRDTAIAALAEPMRASLTLTEALRIAGAAG